MRAQLEAEVSLLQSRAINLLRENFTIDLQDFEILNIDLVSNFLILLQSNVLYLEVFMYKCILIGFLRFK